MRFHREIFFDHFRQEFGKLLQGQVDGLNFLLDKLEKDTFTLQQAAYVLATTKHETGHTFQPVREKRARPGTRVRQLQDRYWGTGAYGRGFVQTTWPDNYRKFGLGPGDYDRALEPEKAYEMLARGMREGMYTKFKLADFVNETEIDYYNARKVVNGLDKAGEIATIAEKFEKVLMAASVTEPVTEDIKEAAKAEAEAELQKKVPEEPRPAPPQINVEHADQVKTDAPVAIDGGRKDDAPKQASQGGTKSTIATILGVVTGIGTAIKGVMAGNSGIIIVGIICATIVLMTWMFRQFILDYLRMRYMSDPTKINVR